MKFMQKVKFYAAGFISACIATTAIGAFAEPIEKQITALYNGIKIYVDGKLVDARDSQGNKVEPFIYNGTTYLPVRAVGQAFDKNVQWDGKTKSIYIGKTADNGTPSVWLSDLDYFNYQHKENDAISTWNAEKDKDSTGASYQNGIFFSNDVYDWAIHTDTWQYTEYLLNQKYGTLNGKFVLHYDDRTDSNPTVLKIYGDEKLLYTSPEMKAGVLPIDVNVNVEGVIKLKVQVETKYEGGSKRSSYAFVDAGLY